MGTTIVYNRDQAIRTASQYDGVAKDYCTIKDAAQKLKSTLSSWEGKAATAFKDTLTVATQQVETLGDEVFDHSGAIKQGTEYMVATDANSARQLSIAAHSSR
ncbi:MULTISPECIES: WXG100 family type VII secretion target [Olsenella]|uniref:WXG100 family type VII secretion target n=1 Tax=Olsenella TaxID=133925 RepID=UPI00071E0ED6|nr:MULTISPECIES: WXG100 family type VII secretion target [Olsenella]OFK22490.1 hypothetical protein HMPREF2826_01725 [Olsenella sp. HMSC062G07]